MCTYDGNLNKSSLTPSAPCTFGEASFPQSTVGIMYLCWNNYLAIADNKFLFLAASTKGVNRVCRRIANLEGTYLCPVHILKA